MNLIDKIKYFLKKPEIIIYDDSLVLNNLSKILSNKKDLFSINQNINSIKFLIKYSRKPIIFLNNKNSFFEEIISYNNAIFIVNGDVYRKRDEYSNVFTYGKRIDADFNISDININDSEINFKLSYKGSTVPFWIKGNFNEEDIEKISGIIAILVLKGMNLVEVSEKIKQSEK